MLRLCFVMLFSIYITHCAIGINPNPTSKNDGSMLMMHCIYCKLIKVANVRKHIVKTAVST